MATLNFYLDRPDAAGKCFILLCYQAGGQKFRHSAKLKIRPSQWLPEKQRIKFKTPDDGFTNSYLDNLESIIKDAEKYSLLENNEISFSYVKQRFNDVLGKKVIKRTFNDCFEEYIEWSKATKKP
jgi:hypothetical protein